MYRPGSAGGDRSGGGRSREGASRLLADRLRGGNTAWTSSRVHSVRAYSTNASRRWRAFARRPMRVTIHDPPRRPEQPPRAAPRRDVHRHIPQSPEFSGDWRNRPRGECTPYVDLLSTGAGYPRAASQRGEREPRPSRVTTRSAARPPPRPDPCAIAAARRSRATVRRGRRPLRRSPHEPDVFSDRTRSRAHSLDQRASRGHELHVGVLEQEAPPAMLNRNARASKTCRPVPQVREDPGEQLGQSLQSRGQQEWTCLPAAHPCGAGRLGSAVSLQDRDTLERCARTAAPASPPGCRRARPRAHRSAPLSPLSAWPRFAATSNSPRRRLCVPQSTAARRRAGAAVHGASEGVDRVGVHRIPHPAAGRSARGCLSAKTLGRVAGRAIGVLPMPPAVLHREQGAAARVETPTCVSHSGCGGRLSDRDPERTSPTGEDLFDSTPAHAGLRASPLRRPRPPLRTSGGRLEECGSCSGRRSVCQVER